ncbi:MAG TPA: methyltransferase domain-containing protein [Acetobacteraceae bacterium]|nr:methyltransferase domain-containing protein [Acetobacteraceae bacterium]
MAQAPEDRWLAEGAARHAAGDLAGAERLYGRVLARRPGDANALNLLGVAARQRGDVARALDLSARAVAARPGNAAFLANQGAALAEAGRLEEAVAALRAALAGRPDDPVTLRNLGQALAARGEAGAAVAPLRRAMALAPEAPEPALALAHALREAGDREGAVEAAREASRRAAGQPALAAQARFLLAALGAEPPPDRPPPGYVRDLFDGYAARFDADLVGRLGYRTPEALAALLREAGVPADGSLRVLDLGCGTGLSGVALRPFARRMEGLDLSPRMLAEAERRGIYAALHEADLTEWLPTRRGAFDLVVAADVLNYLGDLGPALDAAAGALAAGGWLAFSVETGEAPAALGPGMRWRHAPAHVAALAGAAGLAEVARRDAVLREERGAPVPGTLFLLRRA